jgi:hypothetical protein
VDAHSRNSAIRVGRSSTPSLNDDDDDDDELWALLEDEEEVALHRRSAYPQRLKGDSTTSIVHWNGWWCCWYDDVFVSDKRLSAIFIVFTSFVLYLCFVFQTKKEIQNSSKREGTKFLLLISEDDEIFKRYLEKIA